MKEYFDGLNNDGDAGNSSIFQAKIRKEDLISAQEIDELVRSADKLIRNAMLKKQSYEQINQQIHTKLDGLLHRIESYVEANDSSDAEGVLQTIYEMIKNFFDALEISVKWQNFKMRLLKKAKNKSWLASIIKELCDKFRNLLSNVFKRNLGWDEALEKEIKELQEKLESGELSQEETVAVLERLEVLRTMKLKFQMAFVSFLLTSFFIFLESDLVAAQTQETSTEEDKKTKSKEPEVKQAKEIAEGGVKATEENKKDVQPENLERPLTNPREIKDGKEKPIMPSLKDLDLSNLLKGLKLDPGKFIEPKQEEVKEKPAAVAAPTPTPLPTPAAAEPPAPAKAAPDKRTGECDNKHLNGNRKAKSRKCNDVSVKAPMEVSENLIQMSGQDVMHEESIQMEVLSKITNVEINILKKHIIR